MRRLFVLFMCLVAMLAASTSLNAQEVTITLNPGWTWISYLGTEPQGFSTALGSFTPEVGDVIKSQWGNATYMANGQWKGSITQFYPGYGYMYKSTRAYPVSLTLTPQQPASQVVVTTSEPMLITAISAMGGGEVTTEDGIFILAKGLCWAMHENPTTNEDYFMDAGSGVGSFTGSMTDLNISTTYYVRAYAVTADGTTYGDQKTFTTRDGIPTLTTNDITNITGESAISGGNITDNGGLNVTVRGVCWSTSPNPTVASSHTTNGSGTGSFSSSITGLEISTTYYVRAYAVTAEGTTYGDQKTFTTRDGIPTLTTAVVTNITGVTAKSGGNITDNGGLNVTARGVCWSTSPNPTVADAHTTNGSGTGSFSSSITGLEISTTYYVRAYATTNAGTGYGEQVSFTTRDGIPTLTTNDITNITGESAISGGNITYSGGLSVTVRGVCWSTSPNPTVADSHTTNGSGTGSFSSSITGLSINTTYYVRAYATTSAGTGYGEQLSFTTRNGIPTVATSDVTNIGPKWAYSGGTITDDGGGLTIIAKGVCWSISPYPTLADSHTNDGDGTNSYTSYITGLNLSTTYYVRAYVTNSIVTVYGNQFSFTTLDNIYVDLGLPSGTLWATCNVGADTPEDYGDYFAWGETDAAAANWGNGWRMPTKEEWQELYQNTTVTWTTQNGVNGSRFTASNGNSLFLPAAGYRWGGELYYVGIYGFFWSSSLYAGNPDDAWYLRFGGAGVTYVGYCNRDYGFSVRPVFEN